MSEPNLLSALIQGASLARKAVELRLVMARIDAQHRAAQALGGLLALVLAGALAMMAAGFAGFAAYVGLLATGASVPLAAAMVALGFLVLAMGFAFAGQRRLRLSVAVLDR